MTTEPLRISNKRQLFIDERFVAEAKGVTRQVNRPKVCDVAVEPGPEGAPDDGKFGFGQVMEEDGQYRMWIGAESAKIMAGRFDDGGAYERPLEYLTSLDGIHWERPPLGLVEWKGRRENNLTCMDAGAIFKDPKAPPERRYKMLHSAYDALGCKTIFEALEHPGTGMYFYTSPDGLEWTFNPTRLLPLYPDCLNQMIYDTRLNKYVAYLRCWPDGFLRGKTYGRAVCRLELDDPMQPWPYTPQDKPLHCWGPNRVANISRELPIVMSYPGYEEGWTDIYDPHVVQYPWADDVYFAFPERNHYLKDSEIPNHSILDIGMCVSRDGIDWQWPSLEAYIPLEEQGGGRGGMLYNVLGMLRVGDKIYQYHTATDLEHHGSLGKLHGYEGLLNSGRVYRTEQRLDGFVSMDFAADGGELVTPLLQVAGKKLLLNCDASQGELQVELRDAAGKPLPGFAYDDCVPLRVDGVSCEVQSTAGAAHPLSSRCAAPAGLALRGKSAKVFAFEFAG